MIPLPPRIYLYVGIAALFALTLAYAGCERKMAQKATARAVESEQMLAMVIDANNSNVRTIAAQDSALKQWKAKTEEANRLLAGFVADALNHANDLQELQRENRRLRAKDQTPECIAVLRTDITRACPSVDLGLRILTKGCRKDADGRDPCTDTEAFATGTR